MQHFGVVMVMYETPDKSTHYRILMFSFLLGNVVLWIAYRSYLGSIFAIKIKKSPFNDLPSLAQSPYVYEIVLINVIISELIKTITNLQVILAR